MECDELAAKAVRAMPVLDSNFVVQSQRMQLCLLIKGVISKRRNSSTDGVWERGGYEKEGFC
jgi:hypothetical protein